MPAIQTADVPLIAGDAPCCGRCACRLSRYNSTAYCSGCTRQMREDPPMRPVVPPHVWHSKDIRDALAGRDFGRLCRLIREIGSLRQEDMSRLSGLSQAFLSMLESGQRRLTNIDKIIVLLDGLAVPAELTCPMLRMSADKTPAQLPAAC